MGRLGAPGASSIAAHPRKPPLSVETAGGAGVYNAPSSSTEHMPLTSAEVFVGLVSVALAGLAAVLRELQRM